MAGLMHPVTAKAVGDAIWKCSEMQSMAKRSPRSHANSTVVDPNIQRGSHVRRGPSVRKGPDVKDKTDSPRAWSVATRRAAGRATDPDTKVALRNALGMRLAALGIDQVRPMKEPGRDSVVRVDPGRDPGHPRSWVQLASGANHTTRIPPASLTSHAARSRGRGLPRCALELTIVCSLSTQPLWQDDPIFITVGVDRTLRALRTWRRITTDTGLIMAIPDKWHLGTSCLWLGVIVMAGLGLVVVPKSKLVRAGRTIELVLKGGQPFHVYRSLCGLLEHLRAVNLRGRNVMHGLYEPHGVDGASRHGPSGRVFCTELMRKQLHRWQRLLRSSGGVSVRAAFHRDVVEPLLGTMVIMCSDACFGDEDLSAIGGFCHGYFWYFPVPPQDYDVVNTPLLEFLGVVFNIIVFQDVAEGLCRGQGSLLQRTDALTAALTLPRESQRSPLLVDAYQLLRRTTAWKKLSRRLKIVHLFGDCNAFSDRISRAKWAGFLALCKALRIKPIRIPVPAQASQIYAQVVLLERARRLRRLQQASADPAARGGVHHYEEDSSGYGAPHDGPTPYEPSSYRRLRGREIRQINTERRIGSNRIQEVGHFFTSWENNHPGEWTPGGEARPGSLAIRTELCPAPETRCGKRCPERRTVDSSEYYEYIEVPYVRLPPLAVGGALVTGGQPEFSDFALDAANVVIRVTPNIPHRGLLRDLGISPGDKLMAINHMQPCAFHEEQRRDPSYHDRELLLTFQRERRVVDAPPMPDRDKEPELFRQLQVACFESLVEGVAGRATPAALAMREQAHLGILTNPAVPLPPWHADGDAPPGFRMNSDTCYECQEPDGRLDPRSGEQSLVNAAGKFKRFPFADHWSDTIGLVIERSRMQGRSLGCSTPPPGEQPPLFRPQRRVDGHDEYFTPAKRMRAEQRRVEMFAAPCTCAMCFLCSWMRRRVARDFVPRCAWPVNVVAPPVTRAPRYRRFLLGACVDCPRHGLQVVPPRWGSCPARTAEWDESLDPVFFNGGAGESESDSLTEQESDRDADSSGDGDANAGERILDIDRAIQAGYAEYAASRAAAEAAECDDQQWAVSISDSDGGASGSFVVTIALASAPGPSQRICWLCGQRSRFRCLLCFMEKVRSPARYCGEICQRLDWCRHKQVHKVITRACRDLYPPEDEEPPEPGSVRVQALLRPQLDPPAELAGSRVRIGGIPSRWSVYVVLNGLTGVIVGPQKSNGKHSIKLDEQICLNDSLERHTVGLSAIYFVQIGSSNVRVDLRVAEVPRAEARERPTLPKFTRVWIRIGQDDEPRLMLAGTVITFLTRDDRTLKLPLRSAQGRYLIYLDQPREEALGAVSHFMLAKYVTPMRNHYYDEPPEPAPSMLVELDYPEYDDDRLARVNGHVRNVANPPPVSIDFERGTVRCLQEGTPSANAQCSCCLRAFDRVNTDFPVPRRPRADSEGPAPPFVMRYTQPPDSGPGSIHKNIIYVWYCRVCQSSSCVEGSFAKQWQDNPLCGLCWSEHKKSCVGAPVRLGYCGLRLPEIKMAGRVVAGARVSVVHSLRPVRVPSGASLRNRTGTVMSIDSGGLCRMRLDVGYFETRADGERVHVARLLIAAEHLTVVPELYPGQAGLPGVAEYPMAALTPVEFTEAGPWVPELTHVNGGGSDVSPSAYTRIFQRLRESGSVSPSATRPPASRPNSRLLAAMGGPSATPEEAAPLASAPTQSRLQALMGLGPASGAPAARPTPYPMPPVRSRTSQLPPLTNQIIGTISMPAAPPSRNIPASALSEASSSYARQRAAALAAGPEPEMQLKAGVAGMMALGEALNEASEFGINSNTLRKDDRAWTFWETVCKRMDTSPLRTSQEVRDHPERQSFLLAVLMMYASAVCVPKTQGRQCIKPRSALAYPLAIVRIFGRWGITMPGFRSIKAALHGLMRQYLLYHGPHSLQPKRAEPMRFSMVQKINRMVRDGTHRIHGLIWREDNHLVFIFLRLNLFLMYTAFRLAEIVAHSSGEVMYVTRSDVHLNLGGVIIDDPTPAQLDAMRSGVDKVGVTPPRSKPDQWGEIHCPFPVYLTYYDEPENAARAILDIERRTPCRGAARQGTPLFADETGQPYTHARLDGLFNAVMAYVFSTAVASIYTFHSYRSGLATALFAANVPDGVIMLMCRWMCPESLHVYRRMTAAKHDEYLRRIPSVDVSGVQSVNVPRTSGDAGFAELSAAFASTALEQQVVGEYGAAQTGRSHQAAPAPRQPAASQVSLGPGAAPSATDGIGCPVLVPRALWPSYTCNENGGNGWSGAIVSFCGSTAVVKFTSAATATGQRYEDERLPLSSLRKA